MQTHTYARGKNLFLQNRKTDYHHITSSKRGKDLRLSNHNAETLTVFYFLLFTWSVSKPETSAVMRRVLASIFVSLKLKMGGTPEMLANNSFFPKNWFPLSHLLYAYGPPVSLITKHIIKIFWQTTFFPIMSSNIIAVSRSKSPPKGMARPFYILLYFLSSEAWRW